MKEPNIQLFIDGLRKIADWYEANGDTPLIKDTSPHFNLNLFAWSKEEFAKKAKAFGSSEKVNDGSYYILRKQFSESVRIDLNIQHDSICERVLVSEEVIPEHVIPAVPETIVPERVEQKYEWRCPDSVMKTPLEAVNAA